MPVFDRVDVHIIDMPGKIVFIAYLVFPEPSLPETALALAHARCADVFAGDHPAREAGLDQHPACRKVRVVRRQCPYGMQMIRQYYPRDDLEGMTRPDRSHGVTQLHDAIDQQAAGTIRQIDGEEIRAAGSLGSSITHPVIVPDVLGFASSPQPTRAKFQLLSRKKDNNERQPGDTSLLELCQRDQHCNLDILLP